MLWLKLGIIAAVLGSGLWYVIGAEKAKSEREALTVRVQELTLEDGRKTAEIHTLNNRIKANNQRWLDDLAAEKARVNAAKEAADAVRVERDRIKEALAQSRKSWDEVVKNDAQVHDWAVAIAPDAAFDRLRRAAGQ